MNYFTKKDGKNRLFYYDNMYFRQLPKHYRKGIKRISMTAGIIVRAAHYDSAKTLLTLIAAFFTFLVVCRLFFFI